MDKSVNILLLDIVIIVLILIPFIIAKSNSDISDSGFMPYYDIILSIMMLANAWMIMKNKKLSGVVVIAMVLVYVAWLLGLVNFFLWRDNIGVDIIDAKGENRVDLTEFRSKVTISRILQLSMLLVLPGFNTLMISGLDKAVN